jgi:hypothetical protein
MDSDPHTKYGSGSRTAADPEPNSNTRHCFKPTSKYWQVLLILIVYSITWPIFPRTVPV